MKKTLLIFALVAGMLIAYVPQRTRTQAATTANPVLILYDSTNTQYGKLGFIYAIMLSNLLGHFQMKADLVPVETYTSGQINAHQATFYLGALYDNPLPVSFLSDAAQTTKPMVWFKYNFWKLTWDQTYNFPATHGFTFLSLRGLNGTPSASTPSPGFFDTITYKNKAMMKYYAYDAATNTVKADPDFGLVQITDATKATATVSAKNSGTQEIAPYVVRSGNFWYFADLPLSFIGPRDRYLALCDLLHDILGVNHTEQHRAMVRLEDVAATVDTNSMTRLSDFLKSKNIKFSIAAIPFYRDPLGRYNSGVSMEVHLAQATDLLNSLRYAKSRGGSVLMHGYTHQYNNVPNLHTAVSADDFEFWNATANRPVAEDSFAWAADRLSAGIAELQGSGYEADVFEAPHYQASPKAYAAINGLFQNTYQRVVYYTAQTPNLDPNVTNHDFSGGMFYPYVISSDYYGQRVLPENLGNIEYDICNIDPTSCFNYTWQDLLINAQYGLVVRDGFGSFFFHPFWVEQDLAYLNAYNDFVNLVNGITQLGYTWVGMRDLILGVTKITPNSGPKSGGTNVTIDGTGFEAGATVLIGDTPATNVIVVNSSKITCRTPAGAKGDADVKVTNTDGRNAMLPAGFKYK
ncbi:MAG: DUF2334 domain-containing protein [Blastocatellia bacterium]